MNIRGMLLVIVGSLLVSWCVPLGAADETFVITPGTTLEITVYKEKDLSRSYLVDASGSINMPLVGNVAVGDLTVPQASEKIGKELVRYIREPQVNILVRGYGNIYVIGEVMSPGPYQLSGKMRVLDAVGMAGGLKPTASANRVKVIRKEGDEGSRVIKIKLKKVFNGDFSKDVLLMPGDTIIVPERFF